MPEISVIIPNFNHAPFLKDRIESVLNQSFTDFEVIIIDDCSTDYSREIIEPFNDHPKVAKVIFNKKNSGSPFLQWKEGLYHARGNWIWIAESDDKASPQFLEKMHAQVKDHITLIYCDSFINNRQKKQADNFFSVKKNNIFKTDKWSYTYIAAGKTEINESLKWACTINNASAVLFKKNKAAEIILQIEKFRYHGDWFFYLLMAIEGSIAYIPDVLNYYQEHEKNHSKSHGYNRQSKIEHFSILSFLYNQDFITDKNKLLRYFILHYVGFGFLKGPGFGKNGMFREYAAINRRLAKKVVLGILLNKLKI